MATPVSNVNLDLVLSNSSASAKTEKDDSAVGQFASHCLDSLKYNLVQAPLSGITQIVDHVANTNYLPKVQMFEPPKPSEVGSAAWAGDVAGGTAAAAIPLILFHKFVGPGAATALETSATYGVNKAMFPTLAKTAGIGLAFGGVLTPVNEADGGNFWVKRGENALISATALTTMTAGSIALKSSGRAFLTGDITSSAISGAAAGEIDADLRSLANGHGLASNKERIASIASWSLGSAMGGAANTAHEFIAPSTGIRGVRTLADMTKLADSTVKPGHPERYAFEDQQTTPAKAENLSDEALHSWYNRSSVNLRHEIDNSNMPIDWKKQIVSGHQDFTYGLDALANRANPKPIGVVYGSARFKENDFRYQRARYIGGRMAQEGHDVMTGGGPGTMEGANRGAYEAGGTSIGVVLKLPHEKRGNGYQTLTLKHRNFFTRMENLKKADYFIVEDGGIGTGAEALDTLTHIQCGKLKEVPIYFVGKKTYSHMDKWLSAMEKAGTISPSDRSLYRIVDNPDDIFADLARRALADKVRAEQAAAADAAASATGDKPAST